ncbi:unnamed protein product, partial [Symbiodinium necroappetens]
MLTFERLVTEYERVSPQKYPDDLKISTLLSGLPSDVRRYLQLQITDATKYEQLRDIMLTFERSSSSWCSEQVLKAIGADSSGPMDGPKGKPVQEDDTSSTVRRVLVYDLDDIDEETGDSEAWRLDQVRRLEEVGCESEGEDFELPSSSCLWFQLDQDDAEDEREYCRAVRGSSASQHHENQPVEVILDSGADCTVLPAEIYGAVGSPSLQGNMSVLLDAQGNRIAGGEERVQVCFQIHDEDGTIIEFKDRVVLAHVQQPLFCLGKLMKRQWVPECDEFGRWTMRRGEARFPLHWSRNSLATYMTISRVAHEVPQTPHELPGPSLPEQPRVQMIVEIPDELELHAREPGWSMDSSGRLVHFGLNVDKTFDASLQFSPDVITVLSKAPLDPEELGKPVSGAPPRRVEPRVEDVVDEDAMEVDRGADDRGDDARDRPEGPMLGPHAVEVEGPEQEALVINGTRLTETSPLRELRMACVWMGISKNGSKAAVWSRLKREVALAKLKVSVEASEAVKAEYSREPLVPSLAERPSEDLVLLHETTHIPRAPWCEACLASRSREDNYSDALPTREYPILSIDYMFTSTEGEGQPLATHLIIVDSQTKYTQAIAIDGKGARSLKHCVEEIVRMANTLGYTRIGLRYDTEPAMKQLAAYVVATRLKAGLATEEEPVAPVYIKPEVFDFLPKGPGPDEAASDPPSTPAGAGAGASNIGSDADMSLPGESRSSSAMSSDQSSELRADVGVPGVNRVELEAEMPTGHDDREGFSEADGDPLEAGLEVDWRVEECEDEAQPDVQLDYDFSKEWSDRKYEDGPPHLPDDKMELLDAAMDKVELSRLVKMGVLKRLSENDDVSGMMNLQSKFVRDWRFRANEAGTKWTWVRAGARDFYDKLAKVMRDDEMDSFKAAPALFIEPKTIAVSTHVDDFEILSTDERVERLKNKLKAAGLNFSLEGPCTVEGGECHFLKRKFTGTGEGILVSQSGKHIQKLVELVGVQKAAGKQTPCPLNPNDVKDETPLDEARHAIYRTAVGVLLYLGQDRPECLYAIKVLSGKCTCPTEHEWSLLRHLVKFLKAHPDQGERDRKSISAMCIYVNGNNMHSSSKTRKATEEPHMTKALFKVWLWTVMLLIFFGTTEKAIKDKLKGDSAVNINIIADTIEDYIIKRTIVDPIIVEK